MQKKLLNLSLILASLIGYLEWGKGHSAFLFQAEAEVLAKGLADPAAAIHPFTLLPILGQMALLATLFQKDVGRAPTYFGIAGIGILLALMFVIGLITLNLRILSSTLPFLAMAVLTVRKHQTAPRRGAGGEPSEAGSDT